MSKPIMQRLHDREINSSITSFYDGAWTVKIGGSDMAGWKAQELVASFEEAEAWLEAKARELYPAADSSETTE